MGLGTMMNEPFGMQREDRPISRVILRQATTIRPQKKTRTLPEDMAVKRHMREENPMAGGTDQGAGRVNLGTTLGEKGLTKMGESQ